MLDRLTRNDDAVHVLDQLPEILPGQQGEWDREYIHQEIGELRSPLSLDVHRVILALFWMFLKKRKGTFFSFANISTFLRKTRSGIERQIKMNYSIFSKQSLLGKMIKRALNSPFEWNRDYNEFPFHSLVKRAA